MFLLCIPYSNYSKRKLIRIELKINLTAGQHVRITALWVQKKRKHAKSILSTSYSLLITHEFLQQITRLNNILINSIKNINYNLLVLNTLKTTSVMHQPTPASQAVLAQNFRYFYSCTKLRGMHVVCSREEETRHVEHINISYVRRRTDLTIYIT